MLFRTAITAGYPNSFVEAMLIDSTGAVNFDYDLNNSSVSTMYVDATNNRVGIGTTSPSYKLDVNGNVRGDSFYSDTDEFVVTPSDARLKKNITPYPSISDKLNSLNLVEWEWNKIREELLEGRDSKDKIMNRKGYGLIAQEVEPLFPNLVGEDYTGYKTLSYNGFIIPLLKGFQEQQSIIESQSTEIDDLKSTIQTQQQQIQDLINRITAIENQ